jgi:hypothetical protein
VQAELIRRIAALEDHLDDLRERLFLADTPARRAYNEFEGFEPFHMFSWQALTEEQKDEWRAKV